MTSLVSFSSVGWLALVVTQPVVWLVLIAAALVHWPLGALWRLITKGPSRNEIAGRHVLLTGGSEGLGLELAVLCAKRGARVSLVARTLSKLEAAKSTVLAEAGADACVAFAAADVGKKADLMAAVAKLESENGPVDVCIAAAGAAIPKYFDELTDDDFQRMLSVNYMGVVHCAQAMLPGMVSRGRGQFAAVSSMVAACPFVGYGAYGPAKAACRCLLDTLRNEYADTPLSFHIAFPPDTDTPGMAKENETKPWETSHVWPEMFNETFKPTDVAKMILDDMYDGCVHSCHARSSHRASSHCAAS